MNYRLTPPSLRSQLPSIHNHFAKSYSNASNANIEIEVTENNRLTIKQTTPSIL